MKMNQNWVILVLFIVFLALFEGVKKLIAVFMASKGRYSTTPSEIDLNRILQNQTIVEYFINKYYYETLFYYLNKDITFDDNSVVKIQAKYKYRDCIRNLMRPNVFYGNLVFKNTFIQRIYLLFVTQVPNDIKSLIYSYNSGYTIDNYWNKKKEPSIQPYVFDYINKKLNKTFLELTQEEEIAFRNANIGSEQIDKYMNELDSRKYANLCSIIYNINDISEDSVEKVTENEKSESKTDKEIKK